MFESVEHRFCLRHLYANFKKKFGRGVLIRDLMMAAAKATYSALWQQKMNELKELNVKAWEWLMGIPTKQWCKHAFTFYPKCDVLMNNISEAFNSTILVARDKPLLTMCEWIRSYVMSRIGTLKEKNMNYHHKIMPKPRKRLDKEVEHSGNWFPTWTGGSKFEVTHSLFVQKFVVNLELHQCSCNFWELVGIPCRHAISAMSFKGKNPKDYVHKYYHRETYELCYSEFVSPINGQEMWPIVEGDEILPPPNIREDPGGQKN